MNEIRLSKLVVKHENPVRYSLNTGESLVDLNALIGSKISVVFNGQIVCSCCGKNTKKSFVQGYCYKCFTSSPETEACILKPELCGAQWGEARDLNWAKENHLQPHVVYLSYTSNFKVGVTRKSQLPTRWIDQGAIAAIALLEVPNRHIAGVVECFMKTHFLDKTSWKKMISLRAEQISFRDSCELFLKHLPSEFEQYLIPNPSEAYFNYPLDLQNEVLNTINLDVEKQFEKYLMGIKGQYLIFNDGTAINIRKYAGYMVKFNITE